MKKTSLGILLLLLPFWLISQHITESPMNYKKRLRNIFTSKSSILMISMKKDYDVGGQDTTYACLFTVSQTEVDVTNFSIGYSAFSWGGVLGGLASSSVDLKRETNTESVLLEKSKFMDFYKCVNDVYKVSGLMAMNKRPVNALCTCGTENISFGGEYAPDALDKQRFYFEMNGAVFSMTRFEFDEIVRFVVSLKQELDKV